MAIGLDRLRDRQFLYWRLPWLVISLVLVTTAYLGTLAQRPVRDPFVPTADSVITWLLNPIERNAHLRLPYLPAYLDSITFAAGGQRVWAVGAGGFVVRSIDYGETWRAASSGTNEHLLSVTFADGQTGWAVGVGGTIIKSVDGGATWEPRSSGTTQWLNSVTFTPDRQTCWVVGRDGTIIKSVDGGDTWEARSSGTREDLFSVTFADGQTGWAVGRDGTIIKSVDGGDTWELRPSETQVQLESVTFTADGQTGWAVGVGGTTLKSIDGGETWEPRPSETQTQLESVMFTADGQTGWAVGNGGTIIKSIDGGETWVARSSGKGQRLNSVTFVDSRIGWAVGDEGTIIKSVDGGDTWEPLTTPWDEGFRSVTFAADGRTGWAMGYGGTVFKSVDGGDTWEPLTTPSYEGFGSVTFAADGRTGWAVGYGGTIFISIDGGETWEARSSGTTEQIESIMFAADGETGWAVGENGTIVRSTDGGETWEARSSGTRERLNFVKFNGEIGWVVGTGGTIIKSINGGETWEARSSGTTQQLHSITFADGQTGWAVGQNDAIIKSVNGGETWEARSSGTTEQFYSVTSNADGEIVWAAGTGGLIRSTDGGDTWETRVSRPWVSSVTFTPDGQTGWAAGDNSILRTTDGGATWRVLNTNDYYRNYPAPWTLILFVFAMLALLPVFRHPPPVVQADRISDHFDSDRPITARDPDLLKRRPIADAMSRFLRNDNTEPPLTIAITGDWGTGKSSLMNLVQADMEKHGAKTVWFNAWHHQNEQHLFAALLQAVRDQAIPRVWTFRGLEFRVRLILSRARQHPVRTIVVLLLVGLLAGAFGTYSDWITELITNNWPNSNNGNNWLIELLPQSIAGVITLFYVCYSSAASLKRSAVNPARLIAATSGAFRVRRFADQLGFRHRFAYAFNEVAEALRPNTLLILIDDLDRCKPEQVVEILEAINFLVNAGRCYIVIGIAKEQVMHSVGLGFREIAAESAETPDDGDNRESWRRKKRRTYARQYLEKLINIEIPIPKFTDAGAEQLASSGSATERGETRRTFRHFAQIFSAWLAMLAIVGAGIYLGDSTFSTAPPSTFSQQPFGAGETQPNSTTDQAGLLETRPQMDGAQVERGIDSFRPGADDIVPWWSSHLPAWLLVFGAVISITLFVWRRQEGRTRDSLNFTSALKIWHPLIRATTNSPRQMKRFINRVRYLAMASTVSTKNPSTPGVLDRIRRLLRVSTSLLVNMPEDLMATTPDTSQQPSESLLVALATLQAALQDLEEDVVLASLQQVEKDIEADTNEICQLIGEALAKHHDQFNEEVTEKLLTRYREIDSGIVVH